MGRRLSGFLSNDSAFGRLMTKCGIIIGANLMFALFCLPVITIGPALVALYYVCLKSLRGDGELNPFREFWRGFRMNWKQSILCFLMFAGVAAILVLDIRFCIWKGGALQAFKYPCYALLVFLVIEAVYLMPVMAAFEDTIPHLLRNALFFASRRPLKIIAAVAFHAVPVAVTYLDTHMRPLYGFLWATCAAGLIAMLTSELLIRDFEQYLPSLDTDGEEEEEDEMNGSGAENLKKSERQIRREMRRLDG